MYELSFASSFGYFGIFLDGLWTTLWLSAVIAALSMLFGSAMAVLNDMRDPGFSVFYKVYVSVIRNTPLLVQLFVLYFGISTAGIVLGAEFVCVLAFTVHTTAYVAEIIRSGIEAIPRSQIEASHCLGLGRIQTYRHVVFTPALANVYPALVSQFVLTMLGTSLASQISVSELTASANLVASYTFRSFEAYAIALVFYVAVGSAIRFVFIRSEPLIFRWNIR